MMKKLDGARVSRGGRTSNSWSREPTEVKIHDRALALQFSLRSKGGGITDVLVRVEPDDFPAVLASMVNADRKRMLGALAGTLKAEIDRQVEIDEAQVREGRQSVVDAAERAFVTAPEGRDHAERLTRDMVKQLVTELNKTDQADATDEE